MSTTRAARLVAAAIAVALLAACAPIRQLTVEEKLEDFDFLFAAISENHPFLYLKARVEGYDWLAHEAEFREQVRQTKSNAEFAEAVRRMLRMVNNAHTGLANGWSVQAVAGLPGPWSEAAAQAVPRTADYWASLGVPAKADRVLFAVYSGGEYYVAKTTISGLCTGARLITVDGAPVDDYVASLRDTGYLCWDPVRMKLYVRQLSLYVGRHRTVSAEPLSGETGEFPVSGRKLSGLLYASIAPSGEVIYTQLLAEGTVGYVHVRSMTTGGAHKAALAEFFAQVKDLPALIIDIRGNGGGSDQFWMEYIIGQLACEPVKATLGVACRSGDLVQSCIQASWHGEVPWVSGEDLADQDPLAKANLPPELLTGAFRGVLSFDWNVSPEPNAVGYEGQILLLVDDYVCSSAESFAAFAKASGWATLVGGCTGGDGIGITPALVILPNSKMALTMPTTMGLNPDWTANEETHTMPHFLVEPEYEDLLKWLRRIEQGQVQDEVDLEIDTALRECLRLVVEGQ